MVDENNETNNDISTVASSKANRNSEEKINCIKDCIKEELSKDKYNIYANASKTRYNNDELEKLQFCIANKLKRKYRKVYSKLSIEDCISIRTLKSRIREVENIIYDDQDSHYDKLIQELMKVYFHSISMHTYTRTKINPFKKTKRDVQIYAIVIKIIPYEGNDIITNITSLLSRRLNNLIWYIESNTDCFIIYCDKIKSFYKVIGFLDKFIFNGDQHIEETPLGSYITAQKKDVNR